MGSPPGAEDAAQVRGVEAVRDAQAAAIGANEVERRLGFGVIVADVDREERHGLGGLGLVREAVALDDGTAPGVEGGHGEVVALAEDTDGESTALPSLDQLSPVPFLVGIAGFALWHGQSLQDTGIENRVPKVTTDTRTGWTVRLPFSGDSDGALKEYREVVRLALYDFKSYRRIDGFLKQRRDFAGAIAAYREGFRNDTLDEGEGDRYGLLERAGMHSDLGYVLLATGDLPEAEKEFRAAVRSYPKDRFSSNEPETGLMRCLIRMGKLEEAEREAKAFMKLVKDDGVLSKLALDIGAMYLDEQRYAVALDWSERANRFLTDYYKTHDATTFVAMFNTKNDIVRWIHMNRAVALNALGRAADAMTEIDQALQVTPKADDQPYLQILRMRYYVAKTGDHRLAAKRVAEELVKTNRGNSHRYYSFGGVRFYYPSMFVTTPSVFSSTCQWDAAAAYALCVRAAKGDAKLQTEYADQAIATLKKSIDAGFDDLDLLKKEKDLDAIRDRADFKQLVADLEKKLSPPAPPPPKQ